MFPSAHQPLRVLIQFQFAQHTWEGREAHPSVVDAMIRKPYPVQVLPGAIPLSPAGPPVYDICKGEFVVRLLGNDGGLPDIEKSDAEQKLLAAGWTKVVSDATQPLPGIDA